MGEPVRSMSDCASRVWICFLIFCFERDALCEAWRYVGKVFFGGEAGANREHATGFGYGALMIEAMTWLDLAWLGIGIGIGIGLRCDDLSLLSAQRYFC